MNAKDNLLRVAIVHDWLYGGGAELVVESLHKLYPDAPIYTSYCTDEWRTRLDNKVITGYLQHWPFAQLRKFLAPLRQQWFRRLDLSDYDVVISSSGNGEAKFIRVKISTIHINYCHTPTHFYWRKYDEYMKNPGFRPKWLVRLGLKLLVKPLRKRDYQAAQRVDFFIANSSHIQKDIQTYYARDSVVVHPPVNTTDFQPLGSHTPPPRHGFVTWGRLVAYKRFDIAIEACNQLKLDLTVAGSGPMLPELKKLAGPTIKFTGYASRKKLIQLAHQAKAFIFPGEEDFGVAPVEALSAGLPVIAYKSGGSLDYIKPSLTGLFFEDQTVESLKKALQEFQHTNFDQTQISDFAEQFSEKRFLKEMTESIGSATSSAKSQ